MITTITRSRVQGTRAADALCNHDCSTAPPHYHPFLCLSLFLYRVTAGCLHILVLQPDHIFYINGYVTDNPRALSYVLRSLCTGRPKFVWRSGGRKWEHPSVLND